MCVYWHTFKKRGILYSIFNTFKCYFITSSYVRNISSLQNVMVFNIAHFFSPVESELNESEWILLGGVGGGYFNAQGLALEV